MIDEEFELACRQKDKRKPPSGVEPETSALQVQCSTTKLKRRLLENRQKIMIRNPILLKDRQKFELSFYIYMSDVITYYIV